MQQPGGTFGWLEATPLSLAMRTDLWLYPAVEIVHILGFVVLVGGVVLFDLRLLGVARTLPVDALARHLLRWSLSALVLIIPAGLMMFSAHPQDFISNRIFLLKLTLIAAAGINAAMFHLGVYRSVAAWNMNTATPLAARAHAIVSIAIWVSVISCGRLLAYT